MTHSYNHTIRACYIGYITQAIVNNFVPLLFLTFMNDYALTLSEVALITTVNFAVQLAVDMLCAGVIDKFGYRQTIITAHLLAAAGLLGLAFLPQIFENAYACIMLSVVLYAVGGGIIEVMISPIVESCPTDKKSSVMSLLHSFYCWGHMAVVILSTLFFRFAGISHWKIAAVLWAVIPVFNAWYFSRVPLYPVTQNHEKLSLKGLIGLKMFWISTILMLCAGASEQAVSQWASAFAERGLGVSKTVGDLAGPCAFALLMGTSRAIYGKYGSKIPLKGFMAASAVLCIICYLAAALSKNPLAALAGCALCGFSVGIFWPGTLSMTADAIPGGGTAMYALLAFAGDIGCSAGPTAVGFAANAFGGSLNMGILSAIIFPVVMLVGILWKR